MQTYVYVTKDDICTGTADADGRALLLASYP